MTFCSILMIFQENVNRTADIPPYCHSRTRSPPSRGQASRAQASRESIATVIPVPAFAGTGFAGIHRYRHSRGSGNLGESRNMKKFYVYILCSKRT